MKLNSKNIKIELIIVMLAFSFYFLWSITLPFNTGPDELMRYQIAQFIYEHGSLPHGGDASIRNEIWGISYGFTPIMSYIFSALLMKFVSLYTASNDILLISARFISVLSSTGTVFVCLKIGKKIFKDSYAYLLAIYVGLLPQFVFISSYVNNDAFAIFSTSLIIYGWILGLETKWNLKSCIILSIGISICALSYYNAYSYILCSIILFAISIIYFNNNNKDNRYKELLKKGIFVASIVIILIGWWFIRSYIIYDGDIFGLKTSAKYSEIYAMDQYKPSNRQTIFKRGLSIPYMLLDFGWLKTSYLSFIGNFDYMRLPISKWMYFVYSLFMFCGLYEFVYQCVNLIKKRTEKLENNILLNLSMFVSCVITICISIYYSYTSDYQPQGRYLMPIIIPLMVLIISGIKRIINKYLNDNRIAKNSLLMGYILLAMVVYSHIIIPYYYG